MVDQTELEMLENSLLDNYLKLDNIEAEQRHEKYLLNWIKKVFLKGQPSSFIGKKSLLGVYLNAYLHHTINPHPLCKQAYELISKPYVKDTDGTLISQSIIFQLQTIAYDIEDYLEKIPNE